MGVNVLAALKLSKNCKKNIAQKNEKYQQKTQKLKGKKKKKEK